MTPEQRRVVELYDLYGPAIFRRSQRLLRDQALAQDATQDVFLKLLKELPRETHPKSVLSWIFRTTTRHCMNVLRESGRRQRREDQVAAFHWETSSDPEQESLGDRRLAAAVLARFDQTTQAVAVAVLVDGMPHDEVARALDVSTKTVGRKLAHFLDRARKHIARSAP